MMWLAMSIIKGEVTRLWVDIDTTLQHAEVYRLQDIVVVGRETFAV